MSRFGRQFADHMDWLQAAHRARCYLANEQSAVDGAPFGLGAILETDGEEMAQGAASPATSTITPISQPLAMSGALIPSGHQPAQGPSGALAGEATDHPIAK